MRLKHIYLFVLLLMSAVFPSFGKVINDDKKDKPEPAPRIINIVNFIRQSEPRDEAITETVLLETTRSEMQLLAKYNLPGT